MHELTNIGDPDGRQAELFLATRWETSHGTPHFHATRRASGQ